MRDQQHPLDVSERGWMLLMMMMMMMEWKKICRPGPCRRRCDGTPRHMDDIIIIITITIIIRRRR